VLLAVAALDHALAGCLCTELHGPGGATPQAIAAALARAHQKNIPGKTKEKQMFASLFPPDSQQ
jgi:hypothetical protein